MYAVPKIYLWEVAGIHSKRKFSLQNENSQLKRKIFKSKEKIFQDKGEKLKNNSDTFNIFEKKKQILFTHSFYNSKVISKIT